MSNPISLKQFLSKNASTSRKLNTPRQLTKNPLINYLPIEESSELVGENPLNYYWPIEKSNYLVGDYGQFTENLPINYLPIKESSELVSEYGKFAEHPQLNNEPLEEAIYPEEANNLSFDAVKNKLINEDRYLHTGTKNKFVDHIRQQGMRKDFTNTEGGSGNSANKMLYDPTSLTGSYFGGGGEYGKELAAKYAPLEEGNDYPNQGAILRTILSKDQAKYLTKDAKYPGQSYRFEHYPEKYHENQEVPQGDYLIDQEIDDDYLETKWKPVYDALKEGKSISDQFKNPNTIPPNQMIFPRRNSGYKNPLGVVQSKGYDPNDTILMIRS